jgi:hypothetical protein
MDTMKIKNLFESEYNQGIASSGSLSGAMKKQHRR